MKGFTNCTLEDLPFLVPPGGMPYDSMESYTGGGLLDGRNRGRHWRSRYHDRNQPFGIYFYDSMELYADGALLNGQNEFAWYSPYGDRQNYRSLLCYDGFESYVLPTALLALNEGTNWASAYVEPPGVLALTPDSNRLPITVSIASAGPAGTVIYYTLDGTYPTAASVPYTVPVRLAGPTVLTAAALGPGFASYIQQAYPITAGLARFQAAGTVRSDFTGRVGMYFAVAGADLAVWQVARWRLPGNKMPHTVYFVDATDAFHDMFSVVLDASQAVLQDNAFQYISTGFPPPVLRAGHFYYLLSSEVDGGDTWYSDDNSSLFTGALGIPASASGTPGSYALGSGNCFAPLSFIYSYA